MQEDKPKTFIRVEVEFLKDYYNRLLSRADDLGKSVTQHIHDTMVKSLQRWEKRARKEAGN